MKKIRRLLIANRGEIACRVIRTCKELGIVSIAVYSEADRHAEHVRLADETFFIGPAEAASSYLNQEAVLNAAYESHADAIHPGYGFLSENAEFAEKVEAAGILFIGPKPSSMRAMGSKSGAKALMIAHGVPVIPGYSGDNQDPVQLAKEADAVGYPLMIKAAFGGGGKGMRIVRNAGEFHDALASCQREAKNAFGKDRVLLERYIETPRHIEFQIFADQNGQTIHLGERECSAQRRFQKVIEESPSPFLTPALRERMAMAAIQAAKAVNYLNAGTVEFIVAPDGEFFFMEINSRLQVEHPVTEMVTGLDLVRWQIEVAEGYALPLPQDAIRHQGHAIEVRLYAEDPEQQFMPASGIIKQLHLPATGPGLRLDAGFCQGNRVSVYYDPMLAKLIVHADSRALALHAMQDALAGCQIFGLATNIGFLETLIAHPVVQSGEIDTGYLDKHVDEILHSAEPLPISHRLAACFFSLKQAESRVPSRMRVDPWAKVDFWRGRGNGSYRINLKQEKSFKTHLISLIDNTLAVRLQDSTHQALVLESAGDSICLEHDGMHYRLHAFIYRNLMVIHDGRRRSQWMIREVGNEEGAVDAGNDGFIRAPMPGKLVLVRVVNGQKVVKGQEVAVMEAMKMELSIKATADGIITGLLNEPGTVIDADSAILSWESGSV